MIKLQNCREMWIRWILFLASFSLKTNSSHHFKVFRIMPSSAFLPLLHCWLCHAHILPKDLRSIIKEDERNSTPYKLIHDNVICNLYKIHNFINFRKRVVFFTKITFYLSCVEKTNLKRKFFKNNLNFQVKILFLTFQPS